MDLDLYDHQKKALKKLSNGRILWGGVGTGKSRVAVSYYIQNEAPRDVYIITTAKKRESHDWQEEFYKAGIGPKTRAHPFPGDPKKARKRRDQLEQGAGVGGDACGGRSVGCGTCGDDAAYIPPTDCRTRKSCQLYTGRVQECSSGTQQNIDDCSDGRSCGSECRSGLVCPQAVLPEGDRDRRQNSTYGANTSGAAASSVHVRNDGGAYPYSLTVDSWNNIAKYADVVGAFFVFDEQRLVGSGDWTKKFLHIAKRNTWILLSGTPGDTWMDYIPVFIANGFYKNRTEFKREHVVYNTFAKFPKVDRYINVGRLVRQRSQLLVEMPYVRHTRRRHVEVDLPYDKDALDLVLTKRWHVFEDRPLRDVGEMFLVMRRVVNSDPSRLEMVCELWKNHPKLIVFYNFNYELESLRSLKEYYGISPTATGTPPKTVGVGSGVTTSTPTSIDGLSETRTSSGLLLPDENEKNSKEHRLRSRTTGGITGFGAQTESSVRIAESNGADQWKAGSPHPSEKNTSNLSVESLERFSASDYNKKSAIALSPISSDSALPESETTAMSEWNGHRHEPIPQTDRWLYLVQYTAGAEGWNCTETDAMIMYSRNYSWKVTEQAYGRIDRLNTPFSDLWYYDFTSNSMIDKAIGRALKAKESFNEAKFKRLFK